MSAINDFRDTLRSINERANETLVGRIGLWGSARGIGIGLGILLWYALALNFPRNLLPGPFQTLGLAWGLITSGSAWLHVASTLQAVVFAFIFALALGGLMGLFMGINRFGTNFFTPYVNIGLSIPGLAWAATFFVIFHFQTFIGSVEIAPVLATTATVTPYLAINIWKGVESIENDLLEMATAFEISPQRQIRHVIVPNIAQDLFAAFRFGIAISWKVVTVAEFFAAQTGVGYMAMATYQVYNYEGTWAWAATFIIVILIIEYGIFRPIEEIVFDYREDAELSMIGQ